MIQFLIIQSSGHTIQDDILMLDFLPFSRTKSMCHSLMDVFFWGYFMMLSVSRLYSDEWQDG
jgi:hypothetical protein